MQKVQEWKWIMVSPGKWNLTSAQSLCESFRKYKSIMHIKRCPFADLDCKTSIITICLNKAAYI